MRKKGWEIPTPEWWYALCTVLGTEGQDWDYYLMDEPEWELPRYAHQN